MRLLDRTADQALEDLYNRITGDEDARVCKDIRAEACNDQPFNFFAYLWANLLGKVADEISRAKLVIPGCSARWECPRPLPASWCRSERPACRRHSSRSQPITSPLREVSDPG